MRLAELRSVQQPLGSASVGGQSGGALERVHRRLGVAERFVHARRHVPGRAAIRVEFQSAPSSGQRLLLTAELHQGLGQAHVIRATRGGVGIVAPAREDLGKGLDLAADAVEIGQLGASLEGKRAELAGVHVGA